MTINVTPGERAALKWGGWIAASLLASWVVWVSTGVVEAKVNAATLDQVSRDVSRIKQILESRPAR